MIILNYKYNSDDDGYGKWVLLFVVTFVVAVAALKSLIDSYEVGKTCINNEYYYVRDGEIFKHKDFIGYACDNSEVKIKSPS